MSRHDFETLARDMERVYGVAVFVEVIDAENGETVEIDSSDCGSLQYMIENLEDESGIEKIGDYSIVGFICCECGEILYRADWLDDDSLERHCCPICGFEFEINE